MLIPLKDLPTMRRAREAERDARILAERQALPLPPATRLKAYVATREAKVLAESASMRAARVLGKDTHK